MREAVVRHRLPDLPYALDGLEPHISRETLGLHHGRHHRAYVDNLNSLLWGHGLAGLGVEDLIRRIGEVESSARRKVLDNAGQHFNHSFHWKCLRPESKSGPGGAFLEAIGRSFGSVDALRDAFTRKCLGHFGSGWGWLVKDDDGSLEVLSTHDGGTPLAMGRAPILNCDVWEHAYYVDYRSDRAAYLDHFWQVADWEFAEQCFLESVAVH
jgi:Fe-Mn family superoxide dismutase